MPSRAMTSPLSARLRWTQVICLFFYLEIFYHLFNLDLPGHQHSVLKHPWLEEPLLQVMFLSWTRNACLVFGVIGLIVLVWEGSVIHQPCRTCHCLHPALCIFLFWQFWHSYNCGSEARHLKLFNGWNKIEKIVFSAAKLCLSHLVSFLGEN